MSASVKWDGLEELKRDLHRLPEELHGEGKQIVEAAANRAAVEVRAAYSTHRKTGNLERGVVVTYVDKGKFIPFAIVKNRAPHAFIFEYGTQVRHTELGANRGAMPPGNVFVPVMVRNRRAMYERLKALMVTKGLTVSGDA